MKNHTTRFVDGSTITTVQHDGVIDVAGHKLKTRFRLIIGFTSPVSTEKPMNYLGLAFPDSNNPHTLPLDLFNNKIVQQYAVSVCISASGVVTFGGQLLLGQWKGLCAIQTPTTMTVPMKSAGVSARYFSTNLNSLGLVSSKGQASTKQLADAAAVYDTGTYMLSLPQAQFDYLKKEIRLLVRNDSGADPRIEKRGFTWVIERAAYKFLPMLTFNVGSYSLSPLVILIPPKKYAQKYDDRWYELKITTHNGKPIILGRPFFTTYFSSFDMKHLFNNKIVQQYAVSVCISASGVVTFGGQLLLGQWKGLCAIQTLTTMTVPMKSAGVSARYFSTNLNSLGLVSSKGQASTKQLADAAAVYDTGTYMLSLPQAQFDYLKKEIRLLVRNESGRDPKMIFKIKSLGLIWLIEKAAYNFLPTLTFNVGSYPLSPLVIRIPPKKYAQKYDDEWYKLKMISRDSAVIILGRPFFTTYFSSFDMQRKLVRFARYSDRP
ncbi:hypothetical protein FOL47_004634 [Perkinsus chesapeaki]|uniref:Peptidase A1 domain-containing protein n=1 Tax=Perkinsus chesapeaki TaxID=330153 RepID=A0A7J6M1G6_PERCH|nr:hypothetical protein FOL47_004634 [Perkinsus chesapeaki]